MGYSKCRDFALRSIKPFCDSLEAYEFVCWQKCLDNYASCSETNVVDPPLEVCRALPLDKEFKWGHGMYFGLLVGRLASFVISFFMFVQRWYWAPRKWDLHVGLNSKGLLLAVEKRFRMGETSTFHAIRKIQRVWFKIRQDQDVETVFMTVLTELGFKVVAFDGVQNPQEF